MASDFTRIDPASPRSMGVAALLLAIGDAMQARLGSVTVHGELSGFSRAGSGHCYFQLKDADGQVAMVRCAMFRRAASLLDFRPADGLKVEVRGRVSVYEARGELQCVVESMRPLGAGSLFEQFMRLKARLDAEGLFSADRKRPIARFPQCIGVITSPQAAALHDVLTALRRRSPHVRVVIYPTAVQGSDAPAQIVSAMALANQRREVDTLLLCRGGGSLEDLWSFNEEAVVRAVANSTLPVVAGIGHETDFTLADLAADLRAPTPTAAAELSSPVTADELGKLQALWIRLAAAAQRRIEQGGQRLDVVALRFGRPARWLGAQQQLLQGHRRRLALASLEALGRHRQRVQGLEQRRDRSGSSGLSTLSLQLERLSGRLAAVDPRSALSRGYVWVTDEAGRAVTRSSGLVEGRRLHAQWVDGRADLDVTRVISGLPLE